MGNTISEYIRSIAGRYQESNDQKVQQLTEKDFLAGIALSQGCGEEFNRYTLDCHRRYHQNPDKFIDEELGKPGTPKRICYDDNAGVLYRLAMRFIDSKDEVKYNHPYLFISRRIEAQKCK